MAVVCVIAVAQSIAQSAYAQTRGPALNSKVYIKGFPDARIAPLEGNGWSGTQRCFRSADGKLFYVEILFDGSFNTYCTGRLQAAGITNFTIDLGRMSYEAQKRVPGFQPNPDRIDLSFMLHYKGPTAQRSVRFVHMLPATSRQLGGSAGFGKLDRDKQVRLCVASVTADLKAIADDLVERLKHGPIEVGGLAFPYVPGVSPLPKQKTSEGDYKITFVNKTGENLYNLSVSYGKQEVCAAPDVVASARVAHSDFLTMKPATEAVLRWQQGVGLPWPDTVTSHCVTVKLDGVAVNEVSHRNIYFVIKRDDNVQAKAIKWGDEEGIAKLFKEN
jgi:hypothetical protein